MLGQTQMQTETQRHGVVQEVFTVKWKWRMDVEGVVRQLVEDSGW